MKTLKMAALSVLALVSLNSYAEDCSNIPNYVHCWHTTAPVTKQTKWLKLSVDGQVIGPVCAPLNTYSYIRQDQAAKYADGKVHTFIMQQCDNQACAHPIAVTDTLTVDIDHKTNLYVATPRDTVYAPQNPSYGQDCTKLTGMGFEMLRTK